MDYRAYLANKIKANEDAQDLHEAFLQREIKDLAELKEEHAVLEGLMQVIGDGEKAWNPIRESTEPQQEKVAVDMSPKGFSAFIKTWVMVHLGDERLCPGYVERIFGAAIDIYKQKDAQKAYTAEVMTGDEDKTGKADPLREKGQEEAHRQEHEPGGACSPAGMQQAVPVQDPDR